MENLDELCLIEIFSYLDPISLLSVTQVCWKFYNLVTTGKIMDEVKLILTPKVAKSEDSVNLLINSERKYKTLELKNFGRSPENQLRNFKMMDLLLEKLGKTVEKMFITCRRCQSMETQFLQHFSKLKIKKIYFDIDKISSVNSKRLMEWLAQQKNLKDLGMHTNGFMFEEDVSAQVKFQLETFQIDYAPDNIQNFEKFVITQKKLKEFVLEYVMDGFSEMETATLSRALNHIFNLSTLNYLVIRSDNETAHNIKIEPGANKHLTTLRIYYCNSDYFDEKVLNSLIMKFPNVTVLDIGIECGNYELDKKNVKQICTGWPKLEKLYLWDVQKNIWDCVKLEKLKELKLERCDINLLQSWSEPSKGCPNLTLLSLSYCDGLSNDLLKLILKIWKLKELIICGHSNNFIFNDESVKILQEHGKFLHHFDCFTENETEILEDSSKQFMRQRGFTCCQEFHNFRYF